MKIEGLARSYEVSSASAAPVKVDRAENRLRASMKKEGFDMKSSETADEFVARHGYPWTVQYGDERHDN